MEVLLFGLMGRAAVINQCALRRGGSAAETLLTASVLGSVTGLTASSFPLPGAFGCYERGGDVFCFQVNVFFWHTGARWKILGDMQ